MPTVERSGTLYYEHEPGPEPGEAVAFLGDAGYGAWQWGWQAPAVAGPVGALVTDCRGSGRSAATPGPYAVAGLAADARAVLADAGLRRVHLVGAGLGGMVALELALSGGRAASLALVGTAASGAAVAPEPLYAPPDDPAGLRESTAAALSGGFLDRQPGVRDSIVEWRRGEDAPPAAWRAQRAAIEGFDATGRLHEVTLPALVVHGGADAAWPVAGGRRLAEGLPRGAFAGFEGAGHLVGVERSRLVNDRLVGFLAEHADALEG